MVWKVFRKNYICKIQDGNIKETIKLKSDLRDFTDKKAGSFMNWPFVLS